MDFFAIEIIGTLMFAVTIGFLAYFVIEEARRLERSKRALLRQREVRVERLKDKIVVMHKHTGSISVLTIGEFKQRNCERNYDILSRL